MEQAVDSALQRGNHHGLGAGDDGLPLQGKELSRSFLLAAFQQDVGSGRRWVQCSVFTTAVVLGFLLYWGGIRLNLGVIFKWTESVYSLRRRQGWQLVPFAHFMKPVVEPLSGNRLRYERGALNSLAVWHTDGRDFFWLSGSTERQRSRRLVYFYLIPALVVAFVLPPRAGATASRTV